MIPNKSDNIYPYTKKNVKSIFKYYFDIPQGDIDWIFDLTELETNQLEWIAKKVSENQQFLKENVGGSGNSISNFMKYGIEACYHHPNTYRGSQNRIRITKELRALILNN